LNAPFYVIIFKLLVTQEVQNT